MSALEDRLTEDRKLRDAALEVFRTDLRLIRADLRARGVGERIADRLGDGALEVMDEAFDYAEANRGRIAAAIAAVALWFARRPLLGALARLFGLDAEQDDDAGRSDNE